jgi:hypothetical protein
VRARLGRWLRRYLPAEIVALLTAFAGAGVAQALTGNAAVVALAAAWAENVGYYATMLVRELRVERSVRRTLGNLALEFGPAEALDSLLIRPAMMYMATQLVADLALGVLLGKLAADVAFYVPAIASYELRRRFSHTP